MAPIGGSPQSHLRHLRIKFLTILSVPEPNGFVESIFAGWQLEKDMAFTSAKLPEKKRRKQLGT